MLLITHQVGLRSIPVNEAGFRPSEMKISSSCDGRTLAITDTITAGGADNS